MTAKKIASHIATRYRGTPVISRTVAKTIEPRPWALSVAAPVQSVDTKYKAAQVLNSSGSYVFKLSVWDTLNRFLILGTDGGTYYASEKKLTQDAAKCVLACIKHNGIETVNRILEISQEGAAPKNGPALLALAMCATYGDNSTKAHAMNNLPGIARTGTHLFEFLEYVKSIRGWGRLLKEGVANWYSSKRIEDAAFQAVKYRQRNGWSHRDVLRLAHPKAEDEVRNNLYKWIVKGPEAIAKGDMIPKIVIAFEQAKSASAPALIKLIHDHRLPWEAVPTEMLNNVSVFEALLQHMNVEATVRNLPRLTNLGLVNGEAGKVIQDRLTDPALVKRARYHPLKGLVALRTYSSGKSAKGSGAWTPTANIKSLLNDLFYLGFGAIESTGKRTMLALDVSASMTWSLISGMPINPREASAAMAMVTARVEPLNDITAFSDDMRRPGINPDDTLEQAIQKIQRLPATSTDCSLPMRHARQNKTGTEVFIVYTDNETNHGGHPSQELKKYRQETGIDAKLIVVGMTATGFTIADPTDKGMMDVVGFDTAAPQVMSQFAQGKM